MSEKYERGRNKTVGITLLQCLHVRVICAAFLFTVFFSWIPSTGQAAPPSSSAPATPKAKKTPPDVLSLDQLKAKRSSIETTEGLDESVKKAALGFLNQAIQSADCGRPNRSRGKGPSRRGEERTCAHQETAGGGETSTLLS